MSEWLVYDFFKIRLDFQPCVKFDNGFLKLENELHMGEKMAIWTLKSKLRRENTKTRVK